MFKDLAEFEEEGGWLGVLRERVHWASSSLTSQGHF